METLDRAVGKWLVASKGDLDRVTYEPVRVNPNELFTAGDGHGNGDNVGARILVMADDTLQGAYNVNFAVW